MVPSDAKIIITTSPTGLGHIRVTNALLKGLPSEIEPAVTGINDQAISTFYHLISTTYFLRMMLEFTQTNPVAERITTYILRWFETHSLTQTIKQLHEIIDSNTKKVIIVSTHPGVAAKIQKIIDKKLFTPTIIHAVIVTDDSPQRFWMTRSDLLFVPSHFTKESFENQFKPEELARRIIVAPYPINPDYCHKLPQHILFNKTEQLDPDNPQQARICIPISGAAVQLDFYKTIVEELVCEDVTAACREFTFSVVTKEGTYTQPFINYFRNNSQVIFHLGTNDFQTVQLYDELYHQLNPPSLEITKPSEQCFKALTTPDTIGGPILLFTDPVGRQEHDNLYYLRRNGFLPDLEVQQKLELALKRDDHETLKSFATQAKTWRALKLPSNPFEAAKFITGSFKHGIFEAMQKYSGYQQTDELSPNGVEIIWNKIFEVS